MTDSEVYSLPITYVTKEGENVTEPCYVLTGDCFLEDTYWLEGEIIIAPQALIPNEAMRPLNRAAEKATRDWQATVPLSGEGISRDELMEAAIMLRPKEGEPELNPEQFAGAVFKLALRLRDKRQGMRVGLPANSIRSAGPKAAVVMPNAIVSEGGRPVGPGFGNGGVRPQGQASASTLRRPAAPVGNIPPQTPRQQPIA